VARGEPGISEEEQALAKEIQRFAGTAVPHVVLLLDSNEPRVRHFAGFVLRDIEGLTEAHLDALIAARRRGDGWIPPAIARVGSARAVQFLVDDLRERPEAMTQVTWALALVGARAAVQLAHTFESPHPVSSDLAGAICEVLKTMGNKSEPAIEILLAEARRNDALMENRRLAINEVGCIGHTAQAAAPALKQIGAANKELRQSVDAAIFAIGSPEAVAPMVAALRARPNYLLLRDIASLRETGREAGPVVVSLLTSSDREIRVGAARTLGFIGYSDATPLLPLLDDKDDWQLVYVTAESLGRMGVRAALPALDRVAVNHWYPPVRERARLAASVIRGVEHFPPPDDHFPFEYFSYTQVQGPHGGPLPSFVAEADALSSQELKARTYEAGITGFGANGPTTTKIKQTPELGLRTATGVLVGSDRGEWGGELMLFDQTKSPPRRLLDENIRGIHLHRAGIVVVTGLAHMTLNDGALYLVSFAKNGGPEVTRWKSLPGAPGASGILSDGSLFVRCNGGDVVVRPDGKMETPQRRP
jgi:HEAT repeat protein